MDIKVTVVKTLKDETWGFSDLADGRKLSEIPVPELMELLQEDLFDILEGAKYTFEEIEED